jgi:hypothetical protein
VDPCESGESGVADGRRGRRGGASLRGSPPPRLVPVLPVVRALRAQVRGQRERAARLGVAAHQLQRAPEAEQRVVVRGRVLDDLAELLGGLGVAARAEQRAAERLADRGLVGLEVARAGQRDRGGVEVPVLEQAGAVSEELVRAVHLTQCTERVGGRGPAGAPTMRAAGRRIRGPRRARGAAPGAAAGSGRRRRRLSAVRAAPAGSRAPRHCRRASARAP